MISRRLLSNGTLYFSTVLHSRTNRPDEGLYQCVATLDGVGTIVSRTAELKVAGKGFYEAIYENPSFLGAGQSGIRVAMVEKALYSIMSQG